MKTALVVTTIQPPTPAIVALESKARALGWEIVFIGDEPGPRSHEYPPGTLSTFEDQLQLDLRLSMLLPSKHYSRKNLGYILAAQRCCEVIVETDDDNFPNPAFWVPRERSVPANVLSTGTWFNVYKEFTESFVWPRGLPLEYASKSRPLGAALINLSLVSSPVQQGLANGDPDVDAIYRLLFGEMIDFDQRDPVALHRDTWCPFNSQNTTWFREAFPLLYLPSTCSFRMTDIWRSLVAQRIMWVHEWQVTFHSATVYQDRNPHDLRRDFAAESSGYLGNDEIRRTLAAISDDDLGRDLNEALRICYAALSDKGFFDSSELLLLDAWIADMGEALAQTE
jgi:hypothetical protein